MIIEKHIKQIENLLNKEKIITYEILQISFDIACVKFEFSNNYGSSFSILVRAGTYSWSQFCYLLVIFVLSLDSVLRLL